MYLMMMPDTINVMLSFIIIVFLLLFLLLVLSLLPPPPQSALHLTIHYTSCLQPLYASVSLHRTRRTATTPRSCDSAFTVAVTPGTGGKTDEVWR